MLFWLLHVFKGRSLVSFLLWQNPQHWLFLQDTVFYPFLPVLVTLTIFGSHSSVRKCGWPFPALAKLANELVQEVLVIIGHIVWWTNETTAVQTVLNVRQLSICCSFYTWWTNWNWWLCNKMYVPVSLFFVCIGCSFYWDWNIECVWIYILEHAIERSTEWKLCCQMNFKMKMITFV